MKPGSVPERSACRCRDNNAPYTRTYLKFGAPGPDYTAGETFTDSAQHITVKVNSIDTTANVANVTITF